MAFTRCPTHGVLPLPESAGPGTVAVLLSDASLKLVLQVGGVILARPGLAVEDVSADMVRKAPLPGILDAFATLEALGLVRVSEGRAEPTPDLKGVDDAMRGARLGEVSGVFRRIETYQAALDILGGDDVVDVKSLPLAGHLPYEAFQEGIQAASFKVLVAGAVMLGDAWMDDDVCRPGFNRMPPAYFEQAFRKAFDRLRVNGTVSAGQLLKGLCLDAGASPWFVQRMIADLERDGALNGFSFELTDGPLVGGGDNVLKGPLNDLGKTFVPNGYIEFDGHKVSMVRIQQGMRPSTPGLTRMRGFPEIDAGTQPLPAAARRIRPSDEVPPPVKSTRAEAAGLVAGAWALSPNVRMASGGTEAFAPYASLGFHRHGASSARLPWGWAARQVSDVISVIEDERGRPRVSMVATDAFELHQPRLLTRYEVGFLDGSRPHGLRSPFGVARCGVWDHGSLVLATQGHDAFDEDLGARTLRDLAAWLDLVRPGRLDPLVHWDAPPLPEDTLGALRFTPSPRRGSVTLPSDLRPGRPAFEAFGFQFGDMAVDGSVTATLPPGWSTRSVPGRLVDARGRPRTDAVYDGSQAVAVRLLPRFSLGRVVPGNAVGTSLGMGAGRVRVAAFDGHVPIRTSAEFAASDATRLSEAEATLRTWLSVERSDGQDPSAYWSDEP